jgi:cysteine desulfurase
MIYLDHNSTSPVDDRVLAKMLPFLKEHWGNASSRDHAFGWDAREAVEDARAQIAALINADPREIFFTSGATESLALALCGLFPARMPALPGRRDSGSGPSPAGSESAPSGILTSAVEHDAVLAPCRALASRGIPVRYLPVDGRGRIDTGMLRSELERMRPKALCLMAANNETGTLFPIRECAALAHAYSALLLTDAAQALGKAPLDAANDGFDLAAFSAHKIHGPKGIGALYVRGGREAIPLEPMFAGGGQEGGLRGGTLNVPAIAGFGEACRLAREEMDRETSRLRMLRDRLEGDLKERIPGLRINGDPEHRLANTSNLLFPGVDARAFIRDMHEAAVSTRSACSSGSAEASHVLKAMGLSDEEAFASVRFSLGRATTRPDLDRTVELAAASWRKLRGIAEGRENAAGA